MKTLFFTLLIACSAVLAQTQVTISYNPGISFYCSENSLKIMGNKELKGNNGFSLAYRNDQFLNLFPIDIEYSYLYSRINDVQTFYITGTANASPPASYTADLIFQWHNLDIDVHYPLFPMFSFSLGPSVSYAGRTFAIDHFASLDLPAFTDRLQSLCLGMNISLNGELPLQNSGRYFFLLVHAKMCYLHSIWFDDRGRNLENYHQTFLLGRLNLGIGYCF